MRIWRVFISVIFVSILERSLWNWWKCWNFTNIFMLECFFIFQMFDFNFVITWIIFMLILFIRVKMYFVLKNIVLGTKLAFHVLWVIRFNSASFLYSHFFLPTILIELRKFWIQIFDTLNILKILFIEIIATTIILHFGYERLNFYFKQFDTFRFLINLSIKILWLFMVRLNNINNFIDNSKL